MKLFGMSQPATLASSSIAPSAASNWVYGFLDRPMVRDVDLIGNHSARQPGALLSDRPSPRSIDIENTDGHALLGKPQRGCPPDSAAASGQDRLSIRQPSHTLLLRSLASRRAPEPLTRSKLRVPNTERHSKNEIGASSTLMMEDPMAAEIEESTRKSTFKARRIPRRTS